MTVGEPGVIPRRPRLLHLLAYALRGGCETDCACIIDHATSYEHDVVVFGEEGPMTAVWRGQGARVRHLRALQDGRVSFLRAVRGALTGLAYDGVFLWSGVRVPLVLGSLARLPCRVVLHAGNPYPGSRGLDLRLQVSEWLLPTPKNVTVMCCSDHVRRSYRGAPYFRRLPFQVSLNPIAAPPQNPHVTRALSPEASVRIGMVARLDAIKDQATVLRAFARLASSWPGATLHFAGEGKERRRLEALAQELGVASRVELLGSIGDVPGFLASLDVFAYATTPSEGMGNALAEAMAAGLPCVVTDLPVMREVVGDESGARLCRPGDAQDFADALTGLLADGEARRQLSQAAYARARRIFDPVAITRAYLNAVGL